MQHLEKKWTSIPNIREQLVFFFFDIHGIPTFRISPQLASFPVSEILSSHPRLLEFVNVTSAQADVIPTVEIFYQSVLRPYAHLRVASVFAENDAQSKLKNEKKIKPAATNLPIVGVDNMTVPPGYNYNNPLPMNFNGSLPTHQTPLPTPHALSSSGSSLGNPYVPQSYSYPSVYQPFAHAGVGPVNNALSDVGVASHSEPHDAEFTSPVMLSSLSNWGNDARANVNATATVANKSTSVETPIVAAPASKTSHDVRHFGEEDSLMAAMLCVENLTNFGTHSPAAPTSVATATTSATSTATVTTDPVVTKTVPSPITTVAGNNEATKKSKQKNPNSGHEVAGKENEINATKASKDPSKAVSKVSKKMRTEALGTDIKASTDMPPPRTIKQSEGAAHKKVKVASGANGAKEPVCQVSEDFCFDKTFQRQILEDRGSAVGEASLMQMSQLSNFPFEQHSMVGTRMGSSTAQYPKEQWKSEPQYDADADESASSDRSGIHDEVPFMDSDDEYNVLQALDLDFSRSFGRRDMSRIQVKKPSVAAATCESANQNPTEAKDKIAPTNTSMKRSESEKLESKKGVEESQSAKSVSVASTTAPSRLFQHIENLHTSSDASASRDGHTNKSSAATAASTSSAHPPATHTTIDKFFKKDNSSHHKSLKIENPAGLVPAPGEGSQIQGSVAATESGISESYKASDAVPSGPEMSLLLPPAPADRRDPNVLRELPGHFPVSSHSVASGFVISTVPIVKPGSALPVVQGPIIEEVMKFRVASDARRQGRASVNVRDTSAGDARPKTTRPRRITPTYLGPLESRHLFLPVQMNSFR